MADGFACSDCHRVPSDLLAPGHLGTDSIAEMNWSSLAGGASHWNRSTGTCSNIYCHGEFSGGSGSHTPLWIGFNQTTCGDCHDIGHNPGSLSGRHEKHISDETFDCIECHQSVITRQMLIFNKALHVNGANNVSLLRGGTYQNGSCSGLNSAACHDSEPWIEN